ncbi:hypothetical protein [Synechococcus sp. PCC 6312]|uniref:hypothetical protein n=1 Tax=Synechococcus sp. (strain ATCC 27167 / PCC 6312) TaxID=195253 RepID=UPI00029EE4FE|nr:hypothetical protein [Synechococcus sp. PCC 6312]AFY62797.1 hypothetical protein Syn6312_3787 [Synechococcus sp. PCC 6312]
MTYSQYINNLCEQQDNDHSKTDLDRELFGFTDVHEPEYWDCLECAAPPEVLEDCPQ